MAQAPIFPNFNPAFDSMGVESLVNGVWYHILSQAFPFPRYIIAPEYRTAGGQLRGDLFVIRVAPNPADNKAVFAFEGKRAGTLSEFQAARTQLWGYLKDITKRGTRGYSFGVVAAGKQYAIVQNDGSTMRRRTQPIGNGLEIGPSRNPECGNISGANEYNNALVILRSIEAWIAKNVK